MTNTVVKLAEREFHINKKISVSHLPIILIFVLLAALAGGVSGSPSRLLLLCFALNLFLAMVYFINVYLQQSKDKELQYLVALPIEKRDIVVGKSLYVGLVAFLFNVLIHSLLIFTTENILVSINSLFLNTFVATVVGMTILMMSLCFAFEKLMNYSQYFRAIIIMTFIAAAYLTRFEYSSLDDVLYYNPVIPIILYASVIYSFYRFILTAFLRKKSYL